MSLLLHNARLLDPRCEELIDGVEILIEGEHVKEVSRPDGPVARAASCRRRDAARPRRPHRDAGADRCPRPHLSDKAAAGGHGEHAADVDGRERHGADAFDAHARLHHRARHGRRRLRDQGGRRRRPRRGSAALHLRHGHEPDRRPRRLPHARLRTSSPATVARAWLT